jgi:uncharacterized protein (DUF1800 family)
MKDPLAPFEPTANDPFDLRKVGHLMRRAGFAASLQMRRDLVRAGLQPAIDLAAPLGEIGTADALLQEVVAFEDIERVRAFRVWLALQSANPLRERTSVFWHHHFATSNQKVLDPRAMALQTATFDRLGLGRFDDLLAAVCRDPAMLRWLDNDVNTKKQPNENFARELFELFTLGRGHYSEHDVREAARCFTGWHVRDGQFRFDPALHDDGEKSLFGRGGAFDGGDVIARVVVRGECAEFLADEWLRWFVHPEPEREEIDAVASAFERSDRNVGETLHRLLRSRLFFSERAYRSKIKSPAEFTIGTVRLLGGRAAATDVARAMSSLGETWLEPPSVEGWQGGRAWLSPASWLLRSNWVADLLGGRRGKLSPRPSFLFGSLTKPKDRARAAALLLLDGEVDADSAARIEAVAAAHAGAGADACAGAVLHATACLPDYQLL